MRVAGGSHRGRRLLALPGIRPTSERVRQALFNILAHGAFGDVVRDAVVLDAFAGSGALGLEALSRGAVRATFMESDQTVLDCLRRNVASLGEGDRAAVLAADATHPPPCPPGDACTLALLDPPYGAGVAEAALTALVESGWFAPDAVAAVESSTDAPVAAPAGWQIADSRRYGTTVLSFLQLEGT